MSSKINTILIIGATSGIGEAFARRLHGQGKKVIITGRRSDRLASLQKELPGLETVEWDITDFAALPDRVAAILKSYPELDTVFVTAGIQKTLSIIDSSSSSVFSITSEIDTNLTAPILLTRLLVPALVARAEAGKTANLLLTSSTLGYIPIGFYPVYGSTKAAIHAFAISIRQQLGYSSEAVRKNFSLVEVVPPYVDTDLDAASREAHIAAQGGKDKAFPAMPLADYINEVFKSLDELDEQGKLKKEVGVGFGQVSIDTWRGSFGKIVQSFGVDC